MASLHDLQRSLFPTARPAGSAIRGDRDVQWVRVLRSRVPAFEALDAGDLAVIAGPSLAVVAPDPVRIAELAAALARSRVPAVLLVHGDGGDGALDALADALDSTGVIAFDLGRVDPGGVERSVIGFLVNRRAELDRRAAGLETELARLALAGRGLDVLAATIGAFLGRAVVIEGRRGDVLAVHAPADLPDAPAAVARYRSTPATGAALRVDIPASADEHAAGGRLVLLGESKPDDLERIVADRVAPLLALELARDAAVRQAREDTRRGDPLPADGPPWVVILARQAPGDGPDGITTRERTRSDLRLLASTKRLILRGSPESLELRLVAAAPADDPTGGQTAARIAAFLGRTVAVSRAFAEPGGRPAAEADARATLEAASLLVRPPAVVHAARLAAYLLLGNVRNLPDGSRQARDLLAPVLVGSTDRQRERLATLGAVLDTATLGEAATRLGVHRNTVAYRMRRMEALGGWDLADPDLRFALGLAVRIMQNAQGDGSGQPQSDRLSGGIVEV
jgi:hypothetical protein